MKPFKNTKNNEFYKTEYEFDGKILVKTLYEKLNDGTYKLISKKVFEGPSLMLLKNANN
jgi:hypothetical protein